MSSLILATKIRVTILATDEIKPTQKTDINCNFFSSGI